ncbi:hypothetical protein HYDPIDRAFT_98163 [Hydnomerulius pinastri MD-312]|uniref:Probable RNA-binding protein 18 n=1 Tax=Hydnomerulius pinastri MD-312 TaxID=994086 RepID=A0A0C9V5E6_9AGAM|nr:hypothetical protein HYDPIDRAFT_98163 [Hydnomerulius pinastri MD-312]
MENSEGLSTPIGESIIEAGTHLWIPEPETLQPSSEQVASSSNLPRLLRERLYVGNLGTTVDEYTLLQVFAKFGKVAKLDFLFHKSGPNKGKPRGYAFVEFMNEADAEKALENANGKLLRGRKLVVTFAQQVPSNNMGATSHGGKSKRSDNTPTALSLAKSSGIGRSEASTSSKIAMMEAKLRQMESSSPFTEKPSLPRKPVAPAAFHPHAPKGLPSKRPSSSLMSMGSTSKGPEIRRPTMSAGSQLRTQHHIESGKVAPGPSLASASKSQTESSDATRIPPSSKQRSIPGVKIVKGRLK